MLRQSDAQVFKKYSQMKLQMKREALQKLNRRANEHRPGFLTRRGPTDGVVTVLLRPGDFGPIRAAGTGLQIQEVV